MRTIGGGETFLFNSKIGRSQIDGQTVRPFYGFEVTDPKSEIYSENSQVIEPTDSACGLGSAFAYSNTSFNGSLTSMGVRPESNYPEPSPTSTQAQIATYVAERIKRDRARAQNKAANLFCIRV